MLKIGVDTGGTFTDFTVFDEETNELRAAKVASIPSDPTQAFMQGLRQLNVDLGKVRMIVHGTTIATNAVIERKGARTAALVTKGHGDVLEVGTLRRYSDDGLWNIFWQRAEPYVPRQLRFEVPERMLFDGKSLLELQDEDVLSIIEELKQKQVQSVAVCFLNSYVNADHEKRAAALLREHLPTVPVSESTEVVPEFREFERWSTTVLNAYVGVAVGSYLRKLSSTLRSSGYKGELFFMTSSGGILTESTASEYPVRFLLSGPAAGVSAAVHLGESASFRNIITYDMGGTSTDVCLIKDLKPTITRERMFASVPIKTPQLDIVTIGAGGGSIAWVNDEGGLRVGPQSAGATPGPASYGQGGAEATVTDANLLLGRLSSGAPLGGAIRLDKGLAEKAIESLARQVQVSDLHRLAEGVIEISINSVSGAIRTLSIERGLDPRDFVLVAIGGAGPMHAIPIAEELGMGTVLVPSNPGNACAVGLLTTDLQHDYVRTCVTEVRGAELSRIRSLLKEMEDEGRQALSKEGIPSGGIDVRHSADMRYLGQSFQLEVPISVDLELDNIENAFHDAYERAYGYRRKDMAVELVYLRAVASGRVDKPDLRLDKAKTGPFTRAIKEERPIYFHGSFHHCLVYDRELLERGDSIAGPAVVEENGSTTVVFPLWKALVDNFANLILQREEG